jgi:hypothetical protein
MVSSRRWIVGACGIFLAAGCAHVAVEGGDKPIKIQMDVNVRVANQLDQFFAFEDKPAAATQPSTSRDSGAQSAATP